MESQGKAALKRAGLNCRDMVSCPVPSRRRPAAAQPDLAGPRAVRGTRIIPAVHVRKIFPARHSGSNPALRSRGSPAKAGRALRAWLDARRRWQIRAGKSPEQA
ncbi:MAG: hypothetical protein Q8K28_14195 [Hoeflea sp.]|uniref:hypothetical protein n=1 Tax=Hoeflea sp. TaxID=1940281 RepID=UPI00272FDDCC|nr:hypothetical protein [Hoeflea sp.]MDP2121044.1 hypothetical protein [Hoeflea sp.]